MDSLETLGRTLADRFAGKRVLVSLHLADDGGSSALLSRTVLELDEAVAEEEALSLLGGEVENGDALFFEEVRIPLDGRIQFHEWGEGEVQVRSGAWILTLLALGTLP